MKYFCDKFQKNPFGTPRGQAVIAAFHNQQRAMTLTDMGLGASLRGSFLVSVFDLDSKAREYVEGSYPRLNVRRAL